MLKIEEKKTYRESIKTSDLEIQDLNQKHLALKEDLIELHFNKTKVAL